MNRAWATSIENFWHSPDLPMWLTIAAAGFFAIVLLVTLFRAERSVANGALTVITLLAIGIAVTTMMRASGVVGAGQSSDPKSSGLAAASLPALACLDGLAGESVEAACEKAIFASADSVAASVSYTAAQISRLAAFGNVAAANKVMTPELNALRRSIERDRYGLVAQVLTSRENCSLAAACPFFQSLTNSGQISSNMSENLYGGFVGRYASAWGAAPAVANAAPAVAAPAAVAALPGVVLPPGKTLSGDFPSASSIPPINIMTPEPAAQGTQATRPADSPAAARPAAPARPAATAAAPPVPPAAPKKQAAQKSRAQAPVQLAPPAESDDN